MNVSNGFNEGNGNNQEENNNKNNKKGLTPGKIAVAILLMAVLGGTAALAFQITSQFIKEVNSKTTEIIGKLDEKSEDSKEEKKEESEKVVEESKGVEKAVEESNTVTVPETTYSQTNSIAQVTKEAMPSVVAITSKSIQEIRSFYGFGTRQYESEGAGSGIIVGQNDSELLIVTNNHVVEDANTLSVCFIDEKACEAVVKGTDANKDIAIIAVKLNDIPGETLSEIKVAKLGDSDSLELGEQVIAIGNALGYGQSVTSGIVSALNRGIGTDDKDTYIQTDAAINPGNSGGALLNLKGEVIGINSAKLSSTQIEGMCYAIPISNVKSIMDNLMNQSTREKVGEKESGYLGISGFSVNSDVSARYGIPEGVYIQEVYAGCAAEKGGMKKGDVITSIDGISIDSIDKLKDRLLYYRQGETAEVTVSRSDDGEYKDIVLSITLGGRDDLDNGQSIQSDESENDNHDSEEHEYESPDAEYYGIPDDIYQYFFGN